MSTATLFVDDSQFVGASLEFGYHATHPATGKLLRDWVTEIPGAAWSKPTKSWVVPDVTDIPRGWLTRAGFIVQHADGTTARPHDFVAPVRKLEALPKPLSDVPEWFGYNVTEGEFALQSEGAKRIVGGWNFLADDPGLGKTVTSLCAVAMMRSVRTLILCPPGVMEHWARSVEHAGVARAVGGEIRVIKPTTTKFDLPDKGVVVSSASLVANRYELEKMLSEWQPTVFILDESHAARSQSSKYSRVMRRLSRSCTVSIPASGSAALASPLELAAQLDIAGKLEPLFGSYVDFRSRYTRKTKYGYKPVRENLDELAKILDEQVWVRRVKVSKKVWSPQIVDVDTEQYEESLIEIYDSIDQWLDEFIDEHGRLPSNDSRSEEGDEVADWCSGRGDMTSRLRQAAGLAKVPVAKRIVTKHFAQHPQNEDGTWPEPLIVWAHHHSVTSAMMECATELGLEPRLIDGTVTTKKRTVIEDEFQSGRVAILICSIKAAGVGITLTRSYKSVFAEVDWTPAYMIQAADRQDRIGQVQPQVLCKMLVARGTVDERILDVLFGKSSVLEALMGGDWFVAQRVNRRFNERILASTILSEMVAERLKTRVGTAV